MGKIKKVAKVILNILVILMILWALWFLNLNWEDKNEVYTNIVDLIWRIQGKKDYTFEITIYSGNDITFSNGKTTRELHPMQDNYYRIYSNYVYIYEQNSCFVYMYEGDTIDVKSDKEFDIRIEAYDKSGYLPCKNMTLCLYDMKSVEIDIDKDRIIFKTDADMGMQTFLWMNIKKEEQDVAFKGTDFEIHALEISKSDDGKPSVNLDIDGDGIYEHDGNVYTYDYWVPRNLLDDYNEWVDLNYTPVTMSYFCDYPVIMRGDRKITKWNNFSSEFSSMEDYREYVENFATKEYAQKLIDEGYMFEYNGDVYKEMVEGTHVYQADYSTGFDEIKGNTWMEVSFLTKDIYKGGGYTNEIWRVRYENIDKGKDMRISNVWIIDGEEEQKQD